MQAMVETVMQKTIVYQLFQRSATHCQRMKYLCNCKYETEFYEIASPTSKQILNLTIFAGNKGEVLKDIENYLTQLQDEMLGHLEGSLNEGEALG
jgi:hypothetical protein